ncbi:protein-N(pi)-phosphohistidine--sugar phosphotransferase [Enterococcus silesiacus]|uniref:Permease IIC component n=1 Tax=Enterococcus silesiacus TaxID=332949 RepID=A0A0S3KB44_9ENTE|nr:PTS transporter subunit EIIC [Enterococcus silesiacus]ALS01445.1 protein-N(pi)-phosphohistidine--sugar phosphotransferase [Enterococcus silesiacus]OJG87757.1 PTS system, lactose/cellobiose family IIC component [Enterococcus silesiacus]
MNKLIFWLENSFSPKMNKVNNNPWIVSIKDSIMQTLPFIFLGSIFSMLAILNEYFPALPSFWVPFGWTMGKISLFVAFLIPFNLMEKKRLRKQRIVAGMSGLVLFLMIISPQIEKDGVIGFGHDALGAGGMFVAIVAGLIAGFVLVTLGKFTFFKEESVIPDFVRAWFDSMLPIGLIIIFGWVVVLIMKVDLYNIVLSIFMPLSSFMESPGGFVGMMFLICFLYSMGISTWVLTPVVQPVLLKAIAENIALVQNGTASVETLNLVTSSTLYSAYLWIGGIGCTMPLVLMMMRAQSKKISALGKACIVPSIFNINEPVIFGAVAWNPLLMIPMWLQGIILPIVIYIFTKVIPFAPIPKVQFELWYCPFPFATWFTTGTITGIILMLVIFALSTAIWYPFFKAYDDQETKAENQALKEV